jgi:hypothetical protein
MKNYKSLAKGEPLGRASLASRGGALRLFPPRLRLSYTVRSAERRRSATERRERLIMAQQATSAPDEKKGGSSGAAILGWGILALGTIGFIWFISTQLSVGWENREKDALEMARTYQGAGMKTKLSDHTIEVGNLARANGQFVGEFSWSATQTQGPLYKVLLRWVENSEHKRATWNVDLEKKTVEPADPEAKEFMARGSPSNS